MDGAQVARLGLLRDVDEGRGDVGRDGVEEVRFEGGREGVDVGEAHGAGAWAEEEWIEGHVFFVLFLFLFLAF